MLNLYSVYSSQQKKQTNLDYPFPYDSRNNLKIIKEWKNANRISILTNFTKVLERNIQEVYFDAWIMMKSLPKEVDISKLPIDMQIVRRLGRVFRIITEYKIGLKALGFSKLIDIIEYPYFIARLPFIINRCSLKILSSYNHVKKFRRSFLTSSKRNKANYDVLKVRFLMAKCENILSKKNVPKAKYNAFRAWYLQSFLFKLSHLNIEQVKVATLYKKCTLNILVNILKDKLREIFFSLKNPPYQDDQDYEFLRMKLCVSRLTESIYTCFLRNSFVSIPSLDPIQRDPLITHKLALGFSQLKKHHYYLENLSQRKVRAVSHLADILGSRVMSYYQAGYIGIHSYALAMKQDTVDIVEVKSRASELILMSVDNKRKRHLYDSWLRILATAQNQDKNIQNEKRILFFQTLEKIQAQLASHKLEKYYFTWKNQRSNKSNKSSNKSIEQQKKAGAKALKNSLHSAILRLKNCYFDKVKSVLIGARLSRAEPKTQQDIIIKYTISNQAQVNSKLEKRHKKLHEEWKNIRRNSCLQNILMKDSWRQEFNKTILQLSFQKWQQRVSFSNSKVQEYNQLLEILSNEKDYLSTEVIQLEQEKVGDLLANTASNKKIELSKQIRYLEFLEFQNSNLMELLKMYEKELDCEEIMELQKSMNKRIKRSYSI